MICRRCQHEISVCTCQGELLPPTPPWRQELQQRVDSYRARRQRLRPSIANQAVPSAAGQAPALRVLPFRARAEVAVTMPLEPLAEPVVLPPRNRPAEPPLPQPEPRWEPPPETALAMGATRGGAELAAHSVIVPAWGSETLAEAPSRPIPRRHDLELAWQHTTRYGDGPTCLQLPLPILAAQAEATVCPVAPRARRLLAASADAGVVALASLLFALAGWSCLGFQPPGAHTLRHLLPALAAVPAALAALYLLACEYAGGATLGMRRCGLRVVALKGELTIAARRRRAWASVLSLAALGLGYAWIFFDGQGLTWHDYISRTCVGVEAEAGSP